MKIDELINELEQVREEHGNLEVKRKSGSHKDSNIEKVILHCLTKIREENQPTEKWIRLKT
jgi:hypothetical protein